MKLKNEVLHIKEMLNGLNHQDCVWHTFKKGQQVPLILVKLAIEQGALFEEEPKKTHPNYSSKKDMSPDLVDKVGKKLSGKELYQLNKNEQVEMLKSFGVKKVPRLERGRVKLILELQEGEQ